MLADYLTPSKQFSNDRGKAVRFQGARSEEPVILVKYVDCWYQGQNDTPDSENAVDEDVFNVEIRTNRSVLRTVIEEESEYEFENDQLGYTG